MKKKKFLLPFLVAAALGVPHANADIIVNVSQDGWIDQNDGTVKDGGTGAKLNVATPNPAGASQYSRVAYFGFDTTGIDLNTVVSATLNVTAADNIVSNFDGANAYRFYLVDNSITDSFDETTLTDANAPGHTNGNRLTGQQTAGTIIGDVNVASPAASQVISLDFSAVSLADFVNDTNNFLTVVAEYRGSNNAGYGPATGLGFDSKESAGGGASLTLTAVPEPGAIGLLSFVGATLVLRRRKY